MERTVIIKGNKAIAKIMGAEMAILWMPNGVETIDIAKAVSDTNKYKSPNYLKFHCSYAWLMAAVEKIESLGGIMSIKGKCASIQYKFCGTTHEYNYDNKIDAIWNACVDYAEWYIRINRL